MPGTATLRIAQAIGRAGQAAETTRIAPVDLTIALAWSATAICVSAAAFATLGSSLDTMSGMNVWFQGDAPRVVQDLADASAVQYRTAVHPISAILLSPVVLAGAKLGLSAAAVAKTMVAAAGAANAALMFLTLRRLRLPRSAASVFVALLLSSAAYLHWYACVELGPFASLTITAALFALARGRTLGLVWWVAISALTLGVTITNWSAGLAATVARWPLRRTAMISMTALAMVVIVAAAQNEAFRKTCFFLNYDFVQQEAQWTQIAMEREGKAVWSPARNLYAMYATTVVAPAPELKVAPGLTVVTNQTPSLAGASAAQAAATLAWLLLLGLGVLAAATRRSLRRVAAGLGLMLFAQTVLHSVYGDVTFLYAPHLLPMLVVLAALSWFTRARRLGLCLALAVIVLGGANNAARFMEAADLAKSVVASGSNAPS